jgi:general secretion pathway protein I
MAPQRPARRGAGAFTLLEVMVAVAILGLGLVTLLTAQTGLFASSKRAATLSEAIGLARCKMSEIEEHLLREGYQLTTEDEEGPCCEDDESALRCKWSIATVMLPEFSMSSADAGAGEGEDESASSMTLDGLGEAKDSLAQGDTASSVGKMQEMMSGGMGSGGPSMGAGALAPLAMGMIYPQLKAMLEASIRKVTVRVVWMEGSTERDFSVTQYITNPQAGGFLAEDESAAGGASGAGGAGTAGTSTTGRGGSSSSSRRRP